MFWGKNRTLEETILTTETKEEATTELITTMLLVSQLTNHRLPSQLQQKQGKIVGFRVKLCWTNFFPLKITLRSMICHAEYTTAKGESCGLWPLLWESFAWKHLVAWRASWFRLSGILMLFSAAPYKFICMVEENYQTWSVFFKSANSPHFHSITFRLASWAETRTLSLENTPSPCCFSSSGGGRSKVEFDLLGFLRKLTGCVIN